MSLITLSLIATSEKYAFKCFLKVAKFDNLCCVDVDSMQAAGPEYENADSLSKMFPDLLFVVSGIPAFAIGFVSMYSSHYD